MQPLLPIGRSLRQEPELRPYGPFGVMLYFGSERNLQTSEYVRRFALSLEAQPPEGLREITTAFTSILLEFRSQLDESRLSELRQMVSRMDVSLSALTSVGQRVEIPVIYDGPDLDRVMAHTGLSLDRLIELHTAPVYRVCMIGFSPGFPYLLGLPSQLSTPRLESPRIKVPAGSVAIGGDQAGIYPSDSPGGWNVIGTTPQILFPLTGHQSDSGNGLFLLQPGDEVVFRRLHA